MASFRLESFMLSIIHEMPIDPVADLYIVLFDAIRSNPESVTHGREGFYFGENGEHTLYEVGKRIAEDLVALGIATNAVPSTFTDEEIKIYFAVSPC